MAELPVQIVAVGVVLMSARADGWFNKVTAAEKALVGRTKLRLRL